MKKILNNQYFVAALALCALGYVGYTIYPLFVDEAITDVITPPSPSEDFETNQDQTVATTVSQLDAQSIQVDFLAQPTRDPFTPYSTDASTKNINNNEATDNNALPPSFTETPELSAIIINKNKRLAMFDRKIYGVGDTVQSFKIISIEPDYVEISDAVGSTRLMLKTK